MRWLIGELPDSSFERFRRAIQTSSLKTRLMIGLIPPILIIIMITGYLTYLISKQFINSAIKRSSQLQVMAVKHEIESFLGRCRQDLLTLARENINADTLRQFLARHKQYGEIDYLGVAFISQRNAEHLIYIAKDDDIVQIPPSMVAEIKPIPFIYYEKIKPLTPQKVWLSPLTELEHPLPEPDSPNQKLIRKVIQMATPCCGGDNPTGYLLVSVDARHLRNILSLYNSNQSPIWAFQRTPEERYYYVFDLEGWMLFESNVFEKPQMELTTYLATSGYSGTLGRQGLESAFRPDSSFDMYWKMVEDVREGHHDAIALTGYRPGEHYLVYTPIRFKPSRQEKAQIVAGLAYMDVSRLTLSAGYKHIDTVLLIVITSAIVVAGLIYFLGGIITRPILKLAEAVKGLPEGSELAPIQLPYFGKEINTLQQSINTMIATLKYQIAEIRQKNREIRSASLKEQVPLDQVITASAVYNGNDPVPSIVGYGAKIEKLKSEILKAAQVDVDVLIIGETGTGKQLAAEAIHRLSARSERSFISINCGALDENLLLDTLFGHVKGAFTEAKADRKGAFLEANLGTLFLDEIQVASPKVQQAMLRAIAVRKIKPLGSDREIDVDVRLITATNVDLKDLIDKGLFREDLYFRLKVISLRTPALREQKGNIALLARHFLKLQENLTGKTAMGLSKGALSKLMRYDWPGNVRELQNCITRAMVMTESRIVQAEDISLEVEDAEIDPASGIASAEASTASGSPMNLNFRQRKVYAVILREGRITRKEYQTVCGGNLPVRTAIYDLQNLVSKGILKKASRGPATYYVLVETFIPGGS